MALIRHGFIFGFGFVTAVYLSGCTNFEHLRRQKFEPDYAIKTPTTFLLSEPVNGKFVKMALKEDYPLMVLKRGFGYSVVQLYGGRIGEVSTEAIRPKKEGEKFEEFYLSQRLKPKDPSVDLLEVNRGSEGGLGVKVKNLASDPLSTPVEVFPILNNSLESVEPELPEWD
jgi:hypothetical protein